MKTEENREFRELVNAEYNEEPITFCKRCLSIRIRSEVNSNGDEICFCEECGSTKMAETNVFNWEHLYKETYGKIYLDI